jgi:hypothetical protein
MALVGTGRIEYFHGGSVRGMGFPLKADRLTFGRSAQPSQKVSSRILLTRVFAFTRAKVTIVNPGWIR